MSRIPEHLDGIEFNPLAEGIGATGFVRGSATPTELTSIAIEQVKSSNPKQIRVVEGMGHEIYSPDKISGIKKLPPEERVKATREIVHVLWSADVVYVENPPKPKPRS